MTARGTTQLQIIHIISDTELPVQHYYVYLVLTISICLISHNRTVGAIKTLHPPAFFF